MRCNAILRQQCIRGEMRNKISASESAATYLLSLFGASLLAYVFSLILNGRGGIFAGMTIYGWVSYVIMPVAVIGVVAIFSSFRKFDAFAVAKFKPFTNYIRWLLLLPICVATIITFYPLAMLFMKLLEVIGYPVISIINVDFSNAGVFILATVLMAVLPAIAEETLCRGILFGGLSTKGMAFGVFISALLFSLMHQNPLQTVHQFGLGIVLAVVFALSGSIVPCIVLHFLNNFITLLLTAYIPQVDEFIYSLGSWNYLTGFFSVIIGAFLLTVLLYAYHKAGKKQFNKPSFRVVENNVIFDEYSISVRADSDSSTKSNPIKNFFRFFALLFTKRGWRAVEREMFDGMGTVYLGKEQPMLNVWLAIGLAAIYWVVALITGLL